MRFYKGKLTAGKNSACSLKKKPQKQNTPTPNQPPLKPLKMMTEFLSLFTLTL